MDIFDAEKLVRLRELEDREAIEQLIYTFSHVETRGSVDAYLELFTPDAEHETRWPKTWPDGRAGTSRVLRGHEALREHVTRLLSLNKIARRFVSHPQIVVDGDRGTGVMFRIRVDPKGSIPEVTYGRYLDQYRRMPDGAWKFERRVFEICPEPPSPLSGVDEYVPWDSYLGLSQSNTTEGAS
jgi:ketosteroid isomerase-like protein